jgi:hypothetical protein
MAQLLGDDGGVRGLRHPPLFLLELITVTLGAVRHVGEDDGEEVSPGNLQVAPFIRFGVVTRIRGYLAVRRREFMRGAEGRPCAAALDGPASPSCVFGRMTAQRCVGVGLWGALPSRSCEPSVPVREKALQCTDTHTFCSLVDRVLAHSVTGDGRN